MIHISLRLWNLKVFNNIINLKYQGPPADSSLLCVFLVNVILVVRFWMLDLWCYFNELHRYNWSQFGLDVTIGCGIKWIQINLYHWKITCWLWLWAVNVECYFYWNMCTHSGLNFCWCYCCSGMKFMKFLDKFV